MIWLREVAGWILVLLGLGSFLIMWELLSPDDLRRASPLGAGMVMIFGTVIFWGGIHLLKVAIAARICTQQARSEAPPKR